MFFTFLFVFFTLLIASVISEACVFNCSESECRIDISCSISDIDFYGKVTNSSLIISSNVTLIITPTHVTKNDEILPKWEKFYFKTKLILLDNSTLDLIEMNKIQLTFDSIDLTKGYNAKVKAFASYLRIKIVNLYSSIDNSLSTFFVFENDQEKAELSFSDEVVIYSDEINENKFVDAKMIKTIKEKSPKTTVIVDITENCQRNLQKNFKFTKLTNGNIVINSTDFAVRFDLSCISDKIAFRNKGTFILTITDKNHSKLKDVSRSIYLGDAHLIYEETGSKPLNTLPLFITPRSPDSKITIRNAKMVSIPKQKYITILHTNDVHGSMMEGITPDGPIGYDKFYTYLQELREKEGTENVLVVDAGDNVAGKTFVNVFKGHNAVEMMRAVGYNVTIGGNHFFDFGYTEANEIAKHWIAPDPLVFGINNSTVQFLRGINAVRTEQNTDPDNLFEGYCIYQMPGVGFSTPTTMSDLEDDEKLRVCIAGFETPNIKQLTSREVSKYLLYEDPIVSTKKFENSGKFAQCNLKIALTHLGFEEGTYTSNELAEGTNFFDLIIDGHSHTVIGDSYMDTYGAEYFDDDSLHNTLIVQTGTELIYVGMIQITFDYETKAIIGISSRLINHKDLKDYEPNEYLRKKLEDYSDEVNKRLSGIVGKTEVFLNGNSKRDVTDLDNVRNHETNLGKFISSAMYNVKNEDTDIVLMNGGTIRSSIKIGTITQREVNDVLPFINTVRMIKLKGSVLRQIFVHSTKALTNAYPYDAAFGHYAGVQLRVHVTADGEQHYINPEDITFIDINGNPRDKKFSDDEYYNFTTTEYVIYGGDGYGMIDGNFDEGEAVDLGDLTGLFADMIQNRMGGIVKDSPMISSQRIFKIIDEPTAAGTTLRKQTKTRNSFRERYLTKDSFFGHQNYLIPIIAENAVFDMKAILNPHTISPTGYYYSIKSDKLIVSNLAVKAALEKLTHNDESSSFKMDPILVANLALSPSTLEFAEAYLTNSKVFMDEEQVNTISDKEEMFLVATNNNEIAKVTWKNPKIMCFNQDMCQSALIIDKMQKNNISHSKLFSILSDETYLIVDSISIMKVEDSNKKIDIDQRAPLLNLGNIISYGDIIIKDISFISGTILSVNGTINIDVKEMTALTTTKIYPVKYSSNFGINKLAILMCGLVAEDLCTQVDQDIQEDYQIRSNVVIKSENSIIGKFEILNGSPNFISKKLEVTVNEIRLLSNEGITIALGILLGLFIISTIVLGVFLGLAKKKTKLSYKVFNEQKNCENMQIYQHDPQTDESA